MVDDCPSKLFCVWLACSALGYEMPDWWNRMVMWRGYLMVACVSLRAVSPIDLLKS